MKRSLLSQTLLMTATVLLSSAANSVTVNSNTLSDITSTGKQRQLQGQKAQQQIDALDSEITRLERNFLATSQALDSINAYNTILSSQLHEQQKEISELTTAIDQASDMERQILPLLDQMIISLQQFIELDMPFKTDERKQQVAELKSLLSRPDVSTAEKMRKVFSAYLEENDYGRTIQTWRGQLNIDSDLTEVDFLRIGRVALIYRSVSGHKLGAWNKQQQIWTPLTASDYDHHIKQGLKIARKQTAPEPITLPLFAIESADAKGSNKQ